MKLVMLILGILLLVVGAAGFFVLLMRGSESILVYPLAGLMYVGLGVCNLDVLDGRRGLGHCPSHDPPELARLVVC